MTTFTTQTNKPTAEEYLTASETDLVDRMNNNPSGLESETPFIQAVLNVKAAKLMRETNENLVKRTHHLVIATGIMVLSNIVLIILQHCK